MKKLLSVVVVALALLVLGTAIGALLLALLGAWVDAHG